MGRSLTNAMVNLGIDSEMEEALYEVSQCIATTSSTELFISVYNYKPCTI